MHQLTPLKKKIKSKLIGREKGHNSEREQRLAKALLKTDYNLPYARCLVNR